MRDFVRKVRFYWILKTLIRDLDRIAEESRKQGVETLFFASIELIALLRDYLWTDPREFPLVEIQRRLDLLYLLASTLKVEEEARRQGATELVARSRKNVNFIFQNFWRI